VILSSFNKGKGINIVYRRTPWYPLEMHGCHRRFARSRVIVKGVNRRNTGLCSNKRKWTVNEQWNTVMISCESQFYNL